jgi:hypothetical protein
LPFVPDGRAIGDGQVGAEADQAHHAGRLASCHKETNRPGYFFRIGAAKIKPATSPSPEGISRDLAAL